MTVETTHDALLQLIASYGDVLGYLENYQGNLDQAVADYAALASNLRGIVKSEMSFTATIDPDDTVPSNVNGGTFNTVKAAVEASPSGAFLRLRLQPGKTYPIDGDILAENRNVILQKSGGGDNPALAPSAYSTGAHNALSCFRFEEGGSLKLVYTDVQFPQKADAALAWSSDSSLIGHHPTVSTIFGMTGGTVTGHDGLGLMSSFTGKHMAISLSAVTLDGAMFAVKGVASGLALIGKYAVTLKNGAQLTDGGTIGTNILQS